MAPEDDEIVAGREPLPYDEDAHQDDEVTHADEN